MSKELFGLNLGTYKRPILISGLILWSAAIASLYVSSQTQQLQEQNQQAALIAQGLQAASKYRQRLAFEQKKQARQTSYHYENACGVPTNLYATGNSLQKHDTNTQ